MTSRYFGFILFFIVFSTFYFSQASFAADTSLKTAGCKTEAFLLKDLSSSYKNKSGKTVLVGGIGNKKAVELLQNGKIDFAFTCKPIEKLSGKLNLDQNQVGDWKSIPVAIDPIVIVANPDVGVSSLTTGQLIEIFSGTIDNWKVIGGNDLPVKAAYMDPELESGIVMLFKELVLAEKTFSENAVIAVGPEALVNFAAINPGGVTFVGHNSYKEGFVKILAVDGVMPTEKNISNGDYKLAATYYLTLDGKENNQVSGFMEYIFSEDGQKAIRQNFIPYQN